MISSSEILAVENLAHELGFDRIAFTTVEPAPEDRDFFIDWCKKGCAAGMSWLSRSGARRAEPQALLSDGLSVISLGLGFYQGPVPVPPAAPVGRVARYAWGCDYHDVIEKRLDLFAAELSRFFGSGFKVANAVDAQPLLERAFARRAGLGFVGKNTNLIARGCGSWMFLAELVVNRDLTPKDDGPEQYDGVGGPNVNIRKSDDVTCGRCKRCLATCPTSALVAPHTLDARLCVAYHTIENRGWIPAELRPKIGDWLFGCDACQDKCPFNAKPNETKWPEFLSLEGVGPWIELAEILSLRSDEQFKARFRGTSLLRAKRAGLVRNACVVARNRNAVDRLKSELEDCLFHDPDPIVRGHAAWAFGIGSGDSRFGCLDRAAANEPDPLVREEIAFARDGLRREKVKTR